MRVVSSCFIVLTLVTLTSCRADPPPAAPQVDADLDGIWDAEDPHPNDTDNDGITNDQDDDDDNDGVADAQDVFPLDPRESVDTDGDGIGNNADTDDDGDGILDAADVFPLRTNESADTDADGIGNHADPDDDNDGFPDAVDQFPQDATRAGDPDGDGVDSLADLDDDNDGYPDTVEVAEGSNPLDATSRPTDSDGDGLTDKEEISFGSNPQLADSDGDGLSDKVERAIHTDPNVADSDGDGFSDAAEVGTDLNALPDFDHDGVIDALDDYRSDAFRTLETHPVVAHDRFGMNVSTDGTRYIADYLNNAIITMAKGVVSTVPIATLFAPNDVVAASDGTLYIADTGNDRILHVDANGTVLRIFAHQPDGQPGGFLSPRGVDIDTGGNLYVADTWNNRIQQYDAARDAWAAFGAQGSATGNFLDPEDIAVSSDQRIAVADTGNFRVQVFDTALHLLHVIDNAALNLVPFDFQPRSLAFGADGTLFIADAVSARIVVVDHEGKLVRTFGTNGTGNGQFTFPDGIAVEGAGKVYVSDRYRVQEF